MSLLFLMTGIWLLSLVLKDASLVDRFWGLIYVFLSWIYFSLGQAVTWRSILLLTLVSIWGFRLSLHIHLRNRGHVEDIRYQRMRQKQPESFWWYSYFSVFIFQGLLAAVISAPLYFTFVGPMTDRFLWSDAVGVTLWAVGCAFEIGGDWQLKKFKSNPENRGKLLTTGFWSLTRHPNYFGDACLWWGYYFFSLCADFGWVSIIGPLLMTFFLRYVSGVTLLEKDLKNSKPGYAEYMASTPAFYPRLWKGKVGP
jgi:steroid 5-alpha reductase family enzyme